VHWKRSAQTGELVVLEREAEDSRRLSLLLDNALPPGAGERELAWFESLISEAATIALDALERGFEVELVTRSQRIEYGGDRLQRRRLLAALALLQTTDGSLDPDHDGLPNQSTRGSAAQPALRASDASAWTVRLALPSEGTGHDPPGASRSRPGR
jgi:uncharacterized protein (DUF58 family)